MRVDLAKKIKYKKGKDDKYTGHPKVQHIMQMQFISIQMANFRCGLRR